MTAGLTWITSGRRFFVLSGEMANTTIRTIETESRLISKFSNGWSIRAACKYARISRSAYYDWRDDDPEFAKRIDDAIEDGTDRLEDEAVKQAIDGNASMMALMLKGRRPDKYRERASIEHSGPEGGPLVVTVIRDHPPAEDA